ncbi:MAG: hypothetical protein Q7K98_00115 [Candidatus Omnitrophota bacterium]|nr:hypothetical protein [Candidatus Omnitrophota bacterium]
MNKTKNRMRKLKFYVLGYSFAFYVLTFALNCFAQITDDLELTLDVTSATVPLPKIFRPNIDLSGRGFSPENTWPQNLASKESLDAWQKDIGFNGLYRIQFNLWEITQLKEAGAKEKMLANYESVIKSINDAGGTVILNIFGTPVGMGKVLDKKSSPLNLAAFKDLIKRTMQDLSCEKKYNIWYEVWNAPDLENFFLGRDPDYLNLYRTVSESAKELEAKYKIHLPVGAPSASSWFGGIGGNTILTPEESLTYRLIKFCYQNHLNLDFISWHGFSTDPKAEKENTIYDKNVISLVRDWLSYFNFDKNIPFVVSEWNYDRDANLIPERKEKSYITSSYIPARLKNMYEAGLGNQVYFCLEDFQNNKEGVTRNVGVFGKASYNAFRMLKELGKDMFLVKLNDDFAGVLATKSEDSIVILVYNYIDPEIVKNTLSNNIAGLNPAESKFLLGIIRSDQLFKIVSQHEEVGTLPTTNRVKSLLKSVEALNDKAQHFASAKRSLKINLKGLKGDYHYTLFTLDSSCSLNCAFKAGVEKEITAADAFQDELSLNPYSVNLIILKKKPEPLPKPPEAPPLEEPQPKSVKADLAKPEPAKSEPAKPEEAAKDANAAGR